MSVLDKFDMQDKSTLVTGGAKGIGRGYTEAIAEAGGDVVIGDIDIETAEQTAEEISSSSPGDVVAIETDVGEESDVEDLVEETLDINDGLDVAFANAGIANFEPDVSRYTKDDWHEIIDIDLTGVFLTDKEAASAMKETGGGTIINTASIYGVVGEDALGLYAYTSSKGGVIQLTKTMAANQGPDIRVNAIAPGAIRTNIGGGFMKEDEGIDAVQENIERRTPLNRLGIPEDLKGMALYLASDASSFCTGAVYLVDGGWTAV